MKYTFKQKGAFTVEFSIGFLFLFTILAGWVEVNLYYYTLHASEYSFYKSVNEVKRQTSSDYRSKMVNKIYKDVPILAWSLDKEDLQVDAAFFKDSRQLYNSCMTTCNGSQASGNSKYAVYRLKIDYTPILMPSIGMDIFPDMVFEKFTVLEGNL